jgi:hypothetical protein
VLNDALNTPESFMPGGTVHYIYDDNPHANGGTNNFTIQDCVVTYPAGTFQPSDFNSDGVLINPTKSVLNGGTQIDGGELSGISDKEGLMYYSWTSGSDLGDGTWVCNFARDIRNNHGGGGNRKVLPSCYQVAPDPDTDPDPDLPPGIFLGYADDFHGVGGGPFPFFPSPWRNDPGVKFLGCSGAECGPTGKFDSGAIRIDNPVTNQDPMTLAAASVDIGPCHYEIWDTYLPQTANPGEKFILTQTGVSGSGPMPAPCDLALDPLFHAETNFDTSERPGDTREPKHYDCAPAVREIPVINLSFSSGLDLTIQDTGMILNTGGTDSFACSARDEATPWTGPIPYTP